MLPKTTVYYWIKDLPLGRAANASTGQRKGNYSMQNKWRVLREAAYARGLAEYDERMLAPTFRDFVVLYIAEGYKRSRNTASICNSDPAVVALAGRWLRQLSAHTPVISVQYHRDQDGDGLRAFWGETLVVDPETVRLHPKTNSGELRSRVWRCAHGAATVAVHDTYCGLGSRLGSTEPARPGCRLVDPFGAWRSLVSRAVWGREDPGSNPGAPISEVRKVLGRASSTADWRSTVPAEPP